MITSVNYHRSDSAWSDPGLVLVKHSRDLLWGGLHTTLSPPFGDQEVYYDFTFHHQAMYNVYPKISPKLHLILWPCVKYWEDINQRNIEVLPNSSSVKGLTFFFIEGLRGILGWGELYFVLFLLFTFYRSVEGHFNVLHFIRTIWFSNNVYVYVTRWTFIFTFYLKYLITFIKGITVLEVREVFIRRWYIISTNSTEREG